MRYSFIIPYYDRADQFYNTLTSYRYWYKDRNDVEFIVVEDGANIDNETLHDNLIDVLYAFGDLNYSHIMSEDKQQYNPVKHRNYAASIAKGKILILTNPECMHRTNVLAEIDKVLCKDMDGLRTLPVNFGPNHPQWKVPSFRNKYDRATASSDLTDYIVCACEGCYYKGKRYKDFSLLINSLEHRYWFQHSVQNNRMLHWCSAISKKNYDKIGGFDENYAKYCGYDDDDFRETVKRSNIPIIVRDDIISVHLEHGRSHQAANVKPLERAGVEYFNKKWGQSRPMP